MLHSALRSSARFNSGNFCPPPLNLRCLLFGETALLWFYGREGRESVVLCRMRPPTSGELRELCELRISQLKTCPSSTHPPSRPSPSSGGGCPTHAELLLERLGFGEMKQRRSYTLEATTVVFRCGNGVWQRCCTLFAGSVGAGMRR